MAVDDHPLNKAERQLVDVLVALHAEFGIASRFTSAAIEHIHDRPCAGSLAGLVMFGYADQRNSPDGLSYGLTEKAYALFAGVEMP